MKFGLAIALALLVGCGRGGDEGSPAQKRRKEAGERALHVFTWNGYLVPELVKAFETEYGCKVYETNFDDNEALRAKLLAGGEGYDLCCPSDYMVPQLVADGVLEKINLKHVPNVKNLSERFQAPAYDPKHQHSVPYQWGVTGIGYRKSDVKDPPKTWKELFDPIRIAQWRGRISMLEDGRELAAAALLALGKSPNTRDEKEIAAARDLLVRQKEFVGKYDSSSFGEALVAKETVIAQGWSGDIAKAQAEDPDIAFLVPEEGTLGYVDNWAIPKGALEKELAERFIDYCLRPDVAAAAANAHRYASVNEAAKKSIQPDILNGPSYEDGRGKPLYRIEDAGPAAEAYARLKADLKTE
jgi:spermidine/putrescine transport system substrate-binding protein